MGTRLYVGNLSYSTNKDSLREAFEAGGRKVESVFVVTDRETGRSRGFAFVEMATQADAEAAIAAMDGADLEGRALRVNEARERGAPGPGGPGGGGSGPPPRREFGGPPPGMGRPQGGGFEPREPGPPPVREFSEGSGPPPVAREEGGPPRGATRPAKAPWKPRDDYRPNRERDERAGRGRGGDRKRERDDWARTDWSARGDDDDDDPKKKKTEGEGEAE